MTDFLPTPVIAQVRVTITFVVGCGTWAPESWLCEWKALPLMAIMLQKLSQELFLRVAKGTKMISFENNEGLFRRGHRRNSWAFIKVVLRQQEKYLTRIGMYFGQ